jgi:repressor LexA
MRSGTVDDPGPEGDGLTPVRRKIVRVIEESVRSRGYSPSMRKIGDAVGLASTSSVSHQLSVLQAKGYLIREAGRPRTMILRLPGQDDAATEAREVPEGVTEVPLVGRIAAGAPILADELIEDVVPLPTMLVGSGEDLIMLKVAGDSMIGAAIADGDWVVVHRQPNAESGDIVAAMLESEGSSDGEATVKTLKKADGHTWLIPHNPAYLPIMADRAPIPPPSPRSWTRCTAGSG